MTYHQLKIEGVSDLHNNELLKASLQDETILDDLLRNNREFPLYVVGRCVGSVRWIENRFNVSEDEILQAAWIGMITALRSFDFEKGIKFTTYAFRPIIWEVNILLYCESRTVSVSRNAISVMSKMEKIREEYGVYPPPREMAQLLDIPEKKITDILRFACDIQSLDKTGEEGQTYLNMLVDTADYEEKAIAQYEVSMLLAKLDDEERLVATYIMDDYQYSKIAEEMCINVSRVIKLVESIREKSVSDGSFKYVSKYRQEIDLVIDEYKEIGYVLDVHDIEDLLDVCGYDISSYTPRIFYYIRQRALQLIARMGTP